MGIFPYKPAMSAEIIPFPAPMAQPCGCNSFRKALASIAILLEYDADESREIIATWVSRGLLAKQDADDLHRFYGWEGIDE